MVNLGRSLLLPNRPYCRPLNYPKYDKDFDLDVDVKMFKTAIRINNKTYDVKIVNLFNFTLRDIMSDWCNNYMGDYKDCIFT
jgi:hypothetical protein